MASLIAVWTCCCKLRIMCGGVRRTGTLVLRLRFVSFERFDASELGRRVQVGKQVPVIAEPPELFGGHHSKPYLREKIPHRELSLGQPSGNWFQARARVGGTQRMESVLGPGYDRIAFISQ